MKSGAAINSILCVVGARPNFMKIAPIMRAFAADRSEYEALLLHTGQHYDAEMKHSFFEQLHIPEPDIDLGVGSGTHAQQTAEIMKRFEPVLVSLAPKAVLVVGDVNSTIACALVAVKIGVPVIHVEAGLRSGDRTMPEEINRILTDQISDLLFTTEVSAADNLAKEGVVGEVHCVGNVMIDTLRFNLESTRSPKEIFEELGILEKVEDGYGLLTMHRPSNVDKPDVLERLLRVLGKISLDIPLLFPCHPRTAARIAEAGYDQLLADYRIVMLPPIGYLEMLGLMKGAKLIFTDSGGIQEEATALGLPCLTLRENTERPITVDQGTNTIVGSDEKLIFSSYQEIINRGGKTGRIPELWDGKAAERLVAITRNWLGKRNC